jgi:hypothetical protein
MGKIESLVQDFLAQKVIAVVGVSDKRDTGCNLNYKARPCHHPHVVEDAWIYAFARLN